MIDDGIPLAPRAAPDGKLDVAIAGIRIGVTGATRRQVPGKAHRLDRGASRWDS
jgi:hypothetical protein